MVVDTPLRNDTYVLGGKGRFGHISATGQASVASRPGSVMPTASFIPLGRVLRVPGSARHTQPLPRSGVRLGPRSDEIGRGISPSPLRARRPTVGHHCARDVRRVFSVRRGPCAPHAASSFGSRPWWARSELPTDSLGGVPSSSRALRRLFVDPVVDVDLARCQRSLLSSRDRERRGAAVRGYAGAFLALRRVARRAATCSRSPSGEAAGGTPRTRDLRVSPPPFRASGMGDTG
jgi:hypothetical protein